MLHELRISNLKSFRGPHRVPLAPLTLIYGANSTGKSTLIQALLLLKQTVEGSDPEQPELVVRGALADLGSIPGLIHEHDVTRTRSRIPSLVRFAKEETAASREVPTTS